MKIIFVFLLSLGVAHAQTLTVATFNVRYDSPNDIGNLWKDRQAYVAALIAFHEFDIVGTQEAQPHQLRDLAQALPSYSWYGRGRDDGKEAGEHSAIFYKKEKFTLLKSGDFWLSETPDRPGLGWDATCCNRICSWVYVQEKSTRKKFYFFNVHFDHEGKIARVESGKLMLRKIQAIAGNEPAIVVGDLNGGRETEWYQHLATNNTLHDSYTDVKTPYENGGSFNDFGRNLADKQVIDHIFLTTSLRATSWGLLTDSYSGKYPSDHFPVMVKVVFGK